MASILLGDETFQCSSGVLTRIADRALGQVTPNGVHALGVITTSAPSSPAAVEPLPQCAGGFPACCKGEEQFML